MSVFAVSGVRLNPQGKVSHVRWGVVDTKSNHWVSPEVEAPAAAVLEALRLGDQVFALFPGDAGHVPERQFVALADGDGDGPEALALEGPATAGRELRDMDRLDA